MSNCLNFPTTLVLFRQLARLRLRSALASWRAEAASAAQERTRELLQAQRAARVHRARTLRAALGAWRARTQERRRLARAERLIAARTTRRQAGARMTKHRVASPVQGTSAEHNTTADVGLHQRG